jgi:predicted transcriptional regulator
MRTLGDLERSVMEQLWSAPEPVTVREVHDRLAGPRELAYTTVMTVLDRLAKKGLASRERDGKAWRYRAAAAREDLVADLMRDALDGAGDRQAALVRFVDQVSATDADLLRDALARLETPEPVRRPRRAAAVRRKRGAGGAAGGSSGQGAAGR